MSDIRLRVAHEALLTHWERAKTQIKEDKGLLEVRRRVETDMRLWEQSGKPSGLLLPAGLKLIEAEKLSKEWEKELDVGIRNYIQASLTAEEDRQKKEREMQEELKQRLVEAEHNFGLILLEKASQYRAAGRHNEVYVYIFHALNKLKPDTAWRKILEKNLINSPSIPCKILKKPRLHVGAINTLAYAPDGLTIASGSCDSTINLWDVATGVLRRTLNGHKGDVVSIAFSPDGRTLASGSWDRTIRIWDVATGELHLTLNEHKYRVTSIAFSPDGSTLASVSWDKNICLWDLANGKLQHTLSYHSNYVNSVAFSSDGRFLASGSKDFTICVWDMNFKIPLHTLNHGEEVNCVNFRPGTYTLASASRNKVCLWNAITMKLGRSFHDGDVSNIIFSHDGDTLATVGKTICLWEVVTGILDRRINYIDNSKLYGGAPSFAFSPDGRTLAIGSSDGTMRLWNRLTSMPKDNLGWYPGLVNSIAFSPDNRTLALASVDNKIYLLDAINKKLRNTINGHEKKVTAMAFNPNGYELACVFGDEITISLWYVPVGVLRCTLAGHTKKVTSIAFSPDGLKLASGSQDNTIQLWDMVTEKLRYTLTGPDLGVTCVAFSPNGHILAAESYGRIYLWDTTTRMQQLIINVPSNKETETDLEWISRIVFSKDSLALASIIFGDVHLWDVATGKLLDTLEHEDTVTDVAFSPDGYTIASMSYQTLYLWDTTTGTRYHTIHTDNTAYGHIAFSPNGCTLALAPLEYYDVSCTILHLWDMVATPLYRTIRHLDKSCVNSVAFSPDGRTIASGTNSSIVNIFNIVTGELLFTCRGHKNRVSSVAFSPDGRLLASGADDRIICLWDTVTGNLLYTFSWHKNNVSSIAFSPSDYILASGSDDRDICLWDVASGELIHTLIQNEAASVKSVAFGPDVSILASGSDSGMCVWDTITNSLLYTQDHESLVMSVAFSSDGRTLASVLRKTIKLWDVATRSLRHTLDGHNYNVCSIAFSPDGCTLASGSFGEAFGEPIFIWDTKTGKLLYTVGGEYKGGINNLAFSPDGRIIASGSVHGINLWWLSNPYPLSKNAYDAHEQIAISDVEWRLGWTLKDLDVSPYSNDLPMKNLYEKLSPLSEWSSHHPFHWLPQAKSGDIKAMLELGVIYYYGGEHHNARHWLEQAHAAGNPKAAYYLNLLNN